MKKKNIYLGLAFIAILSFFSVLFIQLNMDANSKEGKGKDFDANTDNHEKIEKMLEKMTLEEKIGQLMMVGFKGTEKNSEITELIEQKHIGGVIYFDRNMKSPEQVAKLSNSLQQTADQSLHPLPLMVAVDQEGGDTIRMRERVSPLPAQKDLGKNASVEDMYKVAKLNGKELGSMGININFAPVLDLSKTDERSFGKDPEKVYQYGKKAIQGFNDVSITGALKHFPGNGRSEIDPHVETSSVETNQLDLENSDIYPFKQIISEMDNQKFFVMVTHIKYPAYDKEKPASLSKVIIEDLLRGKLKYEGLVVTDDLEMGAVNKYFSYEEMGKQAILAGADLLLVCHEYSHELEVYNGLLEAVKAGEVPIDRINESVKRVLTYKFYTMKQTKADPDQAEKVVKSPESIKYIESLNLDK
ncbi:beta-N-acetylhexosaminidase [Peribacillus sp. CSMR9]|uniref:beta-N-acetylhexosaminidase n=1 Tax=Peribacillus sp. CSMR9 TaxID=2981350 RepID=UPI0029543B87|nr:beta-N-acetylhexosaminidase [Peribacillus sp. CSMR9]MDV7765959.1 beta-N-acetylhexosaminidase [Peribacillus sp. CSMR9]